MRWKWQKCALGLTYIFLIVMYLVKTRLSTPSYKLQVPVRSLAATSQPNSYTSQSIVNSPPQRPLCSLHFPRPHPLQPTRLSLRSRYEACNKASISSICLAGFIQALNLPTDLHSRWSMGQLLLLLLLLTSRYWNCINSYKALDQSERCITNIGRWTFNIHLRKVGRQKSWPIWSDAQLI